MEMKRSERTYKKQMNKSICQYRKSFRKKMNNLRKCNSKEYWKILNSNRQKCKPRISTDILYDFFKNLNSAEGEDADGAQNANFDNDADVNELNVILNEDIIEN